MKSRLLAVLISTGFLLSIFPASSLAATKDPVVQKITARIKEIPIATSKVQVGPIIEQDVAHVSHTSTPEDLIALGRDIERRVLAKAVKLYAQDRIFIVGERTVVFS